MVRAGSAPVQPVRLSSLPAASNAPAGHRSNEQLDAPARLGSFELVRRLGRGTSGHVYLARDHGHDRWVALKVVPLEDDRADPDAAAAARERFMRETQAVGRLHHPGLVAVLDAGIAGDRGWIAMELAHGVDITRYTRRDRLLPAAVVAGIGQRVAIALAHAHAHGVIHRDVKPANIVIDWARDDLKLVDLGIAQWGDGSRTRSGQALGTPDYMSPEQLAGAEIGPASDLYALGVTLYELLAGVRPHTAPTLGALLRAVAQEAATDLHVRRPDLPAGLCRAVMALLDKQPSRRTADARDLAQTLARFADRTDDRGVRSPTA